MLVGILTFLAVNQNSKIATITGRTGKNLAILVAYAALATPFVEWPGSVLKIGLPEFAKAVVFFYFSIAFIRSLDNLRLFIYFFVGCQVLRVLEPLYLHLTTGYWGSAASMEGGTEFLYRLSGAPDDTVNPNGLAFLACTVLPFLYCMSTLSWRHRLALVILAPLCLYAFSLTGSRSGIVALAVVLLGIIVKSKHRVLIGSIVAGAVVVAFTLMSADMQDRYLSLIGRGEKNAATANDRLEGMRAQLEVALRRPLLGHGLGTSPEANKFYSSGPYAGFALHAHNIFLEVWEEIGLVGVILFTNLIVSILRDFSAMRQSILRSHGEHIPFLRSLMDAMQLWFVLILISSLSSYGLSSYDWYLFAGLSLVIRRLIREEPDVAGSRTNDSPPIRDGFSSSQRR